MALLMWLIFGAIVGFIADYIDRSITLGWIERIVVGIVGSVIGGAIGSLIATGTISLTTAASFDIVSILLSVIGALIALFVYKRIAHGKHAGNL